CSQTTSQPKPLRPCASRRALRRRLGAALSFSDRRAGLRRPRPMPGRRPVENFFCEQGRKYATDARRWPTWLMDGGACTMNPNERVSDTVLRGTPYRPVRLLGSGAAADVFEALGPVGEVRAVKVLRGAVSSRRAAARFDREIRALSSVG